MKLETYLSVCLVVLVSQIAAGAEVEMPNFDTNKTCQRSGAVQTPEKCTQDEQAARAQLAASWTQFQQSDALRCIQATTDVAGLTGYVELLTCLQAARIDEKKPTDPFGALPTISK